MTDEESINFVGGDPGAVRHGNFINYYSFHSATQRIRNLNPKMFPNCPSNVICCVDIGCNTGELTKELYEYLQNIFPDKSVHILGVDIDECLINRANLDNNNPNIQYATIDIMSTKGPNFLLRYLEALSKKQFDYSFCFSVTMWIHLNNGDDGLVRFLQMLKDWSTTIVIEPQPWNCYRNAQRRLKKSGHNFDLYQQLKIRSDVDKFIEDALSEKPFVKVVESEKSSWQRKVLCFTNSTNSISN